jgi:gamma-glutamyltranspeptidase/glutathione hydrolase
MTVQPPGAPTTASRGSRSVALGRTGLIATSQPLASGAGLEVFRNGGNAIDAAVTAAAVLAVVEPTMTGIGGDLFAMVHDGATGRTRGLNASGRSPHAASLDQLWALGHTSIPDHGALSVTVPGAVDGWSLLLAEHGTIPLRQALAPAIAYARGGFPVAEVVARQWREAASTLATDPAAAAAFLPQGRAPLPGEVFSCPTLAATLEVIATEGRDAFYGGDLGRRIARDVEQRGGWLTTADLRDHRSEWVDPIRATYADVELLELPPNTQGFVALEALNILRDDDLGQLGHNSATYLHLVLEALAIAFADRDAYLADAAAVPDATLRQLISPDYARSRRREIENDRARAHRPARIGTGPEGDDEVGSGAPRGAGDTVYLAAADDRGNMVSLIQSLYAGFGAGIVAGDTGVVLHNRGSLFAADPAHPNHLAPHKRPLHTLAPAMVFRKGRPWLAYGVMGGDMQPQGHLQVLLNLTCFGMNIQQAGEAPRARYDPAGVGLESGIAVATGDDLRRRGHQLVDGLGFGGFQGVLVDPSTGVLMGGSDPRKDGLAIGL